MNRRRFFKIAPGMVAVKQIAKNLKPPIGENPCKEIPLPDLPTLVKTDVGDGWVYHRYSDGNTVKLKMNPMFDR